MLMALRNVKMLVSLSCEEASRLASDSLDRDLSKSERWALRLHTFFCGSCRRLVAQLKALRALASKMPESAHEQLRTALPQLSADRKQHIKQLLADARRADQG
jgi:Putative zinc-finger